MWVMCWNILNVLFLVLLNVLGELLPLMFQFHNDRTIYIIGSYILYKIKVYLVDDFPHSSSLIFLTYRLLYDTPNENDNKKSTVVFLHCTIVWSRLVYNTYNDNQNNNDIMM